MAVCNEAELLVDGACLNCLLPHQRELARTVLLCQWWQSLEAGVDCSPNALLAQAAAGGATTLLPGQLGPLVSQLLCNMGGGAGSASFNCVDGNCVDPGDGSGQYGSLAACQAACQSPSAFGLCFTDASWFRPAYSTTSNRLAGSNTSVRGIDHSRIKLYDIEEIGLVNIGNTRVNSGGVWCPLTNKFYFGITSGSTVPGGGGPAADEAIAIVDPVTFAVQYVGGFAAGVGTSAPIWVPETQRIWFRGGGGDLTVLDPSDNSYIIIADAIWANVTPMAYVPSQRRIYGVAFGSANVYRIDIDPPYTVVQLNTAAWGLNVPQFSAIEYVASTDRLWIGYRETGVGGVTNGVVIINPATDALVSQIVLDSSLGSIPAGPTVIYYSSVFDTVLVQESLFVFGTPKLYSMQPDGTSNGTMFGNALRLTDKGVYVSSVNKEVIPVSGATGICMYYLTESEFKNMAVPTWNCQGGLCADPETGAGSYSALAACETACLLPLPLTYDCVAGSCVSFADGSGNYSSVAECEANCAPVCNYTLTPTNQSVPAAGGSFTFDVEVTDQSCEWTAVSNDAWITVDSGTPGTGDGTVGYTVAANVDPGGRTGTITVAGLTFTVNQDGAAPPTITDPTEWWYLDEASGNRTGQILGVILEPQVPGVGSDTGWVSLGAAWPAGNTRDLTMAAGSLGALPYTSGQDISIAFWTKYSTESTANAIQEFNYTLAAGAGPDFSVYGGGGTGPGQKYLFIEVDDGSSTEFFFNDASIPIDQWFHIAAIYHGATGIADLYLDGTLLGSTSAGITLPSFTNAHFDINAAGGEALIHDEVGIWVGHALTAAEITALLAPGTRPPF